MTKSERIVAFTQLHESGCFIIPNPWDRGSAVLLASLGFRALATSSAAVAYNLARAETPDALAVDETLDNVKTIVDATPLPVNADFQAAYADNIDDVERNIRRCVDLGVAGVSIEDASPDPDQPLYKTDHAIDRVVAARNAIDESGTGALLTARCEAFLVDHPNPMNTVLERLEAFADAGADCLFAPGLGTPQQIQEVVELVAPKPVNVLATDPSWMTHKTLADLGVRRISVGSALARAAWGGFLHAAEEIATDGAFTALTNAESFDALNKRFNDWKP